MGFDSDANRIANEAKVVKGNLVYLYAALRALAGWKPATFTVTRRRRGSTARAGYSVVVGNSKAYGGGMYVAPQAELDDGMLDVLMSRGTSKLQLPARPAEGVQGRARRRPETCTAARGATVEVGADRPFDDVRRRRPDRPSCRRR